MTCEVAVANKLAIALAADSAVTFSGAASQTTYASGANKIFQMAHSEPVAVMIYNDANLAGVPWEIILKAYRDQLGGNGFPRLIDYGDDLVGFLNGCSHDLLPEELKTISALEIYRAGILRIFRALDAQYPSLLDKSTSPELVKDFVDEGLTNYQIWLADQPLYEQFDDEMLAQETVRLAASLAEEIKQYLQNESFSNVRPFLDAHLVSVMGIRAAFCIGRDLLPDRFTGIVIAGFGKDDYMPGFIDVQFHGFLGGKLLFKKSQARSVDHNGNSSLIEAFARRAMVETFTQGASPEVWHAVGSAFREFAGKVCSDAAQSAGVTDIVLPEHIDASINSHIQAFTDSWTHAVFDEHLKPLWRVVASLSVSELAELAETLVLLESLKEKVTQRTQSVGGPIDVAVITKAEGLVWIKRKLYFEPHLNYRYFHRIEATQGARHA